MKRPYMAFLLIALLPSAWAVGMGALAAEAGWRDVARASQLRAARLARVVLELDREGPAGEAAHPSALEALSTVGHAASLYLDGRRVDTSGTGAGPETLDPATLDALRTAPEALELPAGPGEGGPGLLVPRSGPRGVDPAVAVLVAFPPDHGPLLPRRLLLVTALVLGFAALAGWIQLAGRPAPQAGAWLVLVSLVPLLAAVAFLARAGSTYEEAGVAAQRRELGRALAVARHREEAGDPRAVRALTGYHVFRVRDGAVVAGTMDGSAPHVAGLRVPPANFTSAGRVDTPQGPASYAAARVGEGELVVVADPEDAPGAQRTHRRLRQIGAALLAWVLGGVAFALRRRRDPVSS